MTVPPPDQPARPPLGRVPDDVSGPPPWPAPPPIPPNGQQPQWQPPVAPAGGPPTGKQILAASWSLLRQDRSLLILPILSAVLALLASAIIFLPALGIGAAADNGNAGATVGGILAAFAASVISIYFQAALVLAAFERVDGGDPTVGSALRAAWAHKGPIIGWAVLSTTVGLLIRAIEQRFGFVGQLLGFLGGVAWAIATFLAVPVVVAEGLSPIDAVKRSGELIRQTWGTSLRTTLRFGLLVIVGYIGLIAVFAVGVLLCASGSTVGIAVGVLVIVAAVGAFVALATVCGAVSTYARAMIYRFAVGRPVPGVDPNLFAGAFTPKGSRRARFG